MKRFHGGQMSVAGISWAENFSTLAARFEHRIAVVDGAESLSYASLFRKAAALADHLLAAGVRPGGRVLVALPKLTTEGDVVLLQNDWGDQYS